MNVSPMMRQYHDAKAACGDALLFFRMGDFYELFYEDAKTVARVLGLTLTSRDKGENAVPMAGFPFHQLEGYLAKLIRSGYRVAVCEQVEDPKEAKGIVRREVTRIVTAGTLTDDALLDPRVTNLLVSVFHPKPGRVGAGSDAVVGIAWAELSTGRFEAGLFRAASLRDELARLAPSEVLLREDDGTLSPDALDTWTLTLRPTWQFGLEEATRQLCGQFQVHSLAGMGWEEAGDTPAICAAGAILAYLQETQKTSLTHIRQLIPYRSQATLEIDAATRRSLEITQTMRSGQREGSLLGVLDRTVTPMGARLLAEWLAGPLVDAERIEQRQGAVEELVRDARLCAGLRETLSSIYDLQRLVSRVCTQRASPRDLKQVEQTLSQLPRVKTLLSGRSSGLLDQLERQLPLCERLRDQLAASLADVCPPQTRDGGFIRAGYDQRLDELRELASGGKQWIARYQAEQVERTGIPSLKVGYTSVFGYYLEITNAHRDKVPLDFVRKQTLKNAERYITDELKQYETKILSAEEESQTLELQLFNELREAVARHIAELQTIASLLAELDVLCGLAALAKAQGYVRPKISETPALEIIAGRHPVLDVNLPAGTFVANDCAVGGDAGSVLLITGPNMAGKSTYIRQVALLTIMAQIGSFVPARQATIGIADRVFARVGASDELARGQSTFMVEMVETARILNTASAQSLVILDEIGRGTSTYDGLSLAWAIVEHLHDVVGARTLFATHYHELTQLDKSLPRVRNMNVAVKEWDENIVFLHRIVPGGADKSYGIHVARLAGVPEVVNERAKDILAQLETDHLNRYGESKITPPRRPPKSPIQLTLFDFGEHPVVDKLRELDIAGTAPDQALVLLAQWQEEVRRKN
jgi:DNA mismatch repair protein MutS